MSRFDAQTIAQVIAKRGCSVWVAAPTMLTAMVNLPDIVDLEAGKRELPSNQEGEILINGPTVMRGYWNQPIKINTNY